MTKIAFLPLAYGYEVCPPLARWRADELSVIEKHPTLLQGVDVVCIFYRVIKVEGGLSLVGTFSGDTP